MQSCGWCWELKHEKKVKKNHRPSILSHPTANHWVSLHQTLNSTSAKLKWCQLTSLCGAKSDGLLQFSIGSPVIKSNVRICSQAVWWIFLLWELYELICPESFLHFLLWEENIWLHFLTFCSGVLSLILNAALRQQWWRIQLCLLLPFSIFL